MVEKIGLDLNAISQLSSVNINISNTTKGIMADIPRIANEMTNNDLAFIILIPTFLLIAWVLSDKTPFQDFGYSDARAINVAFGLVSLLGVTMAQVGWIHNIVIVGFMIMATAFSGAYIYFYENKGATE